LLRAQTLTFLAGSPAGEALHAYQQVFVDEPLPFPDFARLRVRQPARDLKTWHERTVDISGSLDATNCAADAFLEWGDVVEVPETDHPLGQKWPGFPKTEF
jgi:hypothetical protein